MKKAKKLKFDFLKIMLLLIFFIGLTLIFIIILPSGKSFEELEIRIRILSMLVAILYVLFSLIGFKLLSKK